MTNAKLIARKLKRILQQRVLEAGKNEYLRTFICEGPDQMKVGLFHSLIEWLSQVLCDDRKAQRVEPWWDKAVGQVALLDPGLASIVQVHSLPFTSGLSNSGCSSKEINTDQYLQLHLSGRHCPRDPFVTFIQ